MGFRNDIVAFVGKVHDRLDLIPREAAKDLVADVRIPVSQGGHMPVKTGNLRNSPEVSFGGMPNMDLVPTETQRLPDPTITINNALDSHVPGSSIKIGFRVHYAAFAELRHAFVRLSAQRWTQIADGAIKRVVKRVV